MVNLGKFFIKTKFISLYVHCLLLLKFCFMFEILGISIPYCSKND